MKNFLLKPTFQYSIILPHSGMSDPSSAVALLRRVEANYVLDDCILCATKWTKER